MTIKLPNMCSSSCYKDSINSSWSKLLLAKEPLSNQPCGMNIIKQRLHLLHKSRVLYQPAYRLQGHQEHHTHFKGSTLIWATSSSTNDHRMGHLAMPHVSIPKSSPSYHILHVIQCPYHALLSSAHILAMPSTFSFNLLSISSTFIMPFSLMVCHQWQPCLTNFPFVIDGNTSSITLPLWH